MTWFKVICGRVEMATRDSAGFDLFYAGEKPVTIGDKPLALPTGVKTAFSPNLMAIIKEKSGLALQGLEVKAGVIDADFRDEWKVIVRNPLQIDFTEPLIQDAYAAWKPIVIQPGKKIAQVILIEKPKIAFEGVTFLDALREGGFGSTGA